MINQSCAAHDRLIISLKREELKLIYELTQLLLAEQGVLINVQHAGNTNVGDY